MTEQERKIIFEYAARLDANEMKQLFDVYEEYRRLRVGYRDDIDYDPEYEKFYDLNKDDIRFAEQILEAEFGDDFSRPDWENRIPEQISQVISKYSETNERKQLINKLTKISKQLSEEAFIVDDMFDSVGLKQQANAYDYAAQILSSDVLSKYGVIKKIKDKSNEHNGTSNMNEYYKKIANAAYQECLSLIEDLDEKLFAGYLQDKLSEEDDNFDDYEVSMSDVARHMAAVDEWSNDKLSPDEKAAYDKKEKQYHEQQAKPSEQSSGDLHNNGGNDRKRRKVMNSTVNVVGKVVSELELTTTPNNKVVGNFTVVVPSGKSDEDGKDIGGTFYTIETWDSHQQNVLAEHLKKGELVAVQGNVFVNAYSRKDSGGRGMKFVVKNPKTTFLGTSKNTGFSSIFVTGNLTKDPELYSFAGGKTKAAFTVAANNPMAKDEEPNYFEVELWNERSGVAAHLKKGARVAISGTLKMETFDTEDGKKYTSAKISNPEVQFLDKKTAAAQAEAAAPAEKAPASKGNKKDKEGK